MWYEQDPRSLLDVASFGDVDAVRQLLQEGSAVDQRDESECTALHYAADRGHLEVPTEHAKPQPSQQYLQDVLHLIPVLRHA